MIGTTDFMPRIRVRIILLLITIAILSVMWIFGSKPANVTSDLVAIETNRVAVRSLDQRLSKMNETIKRTKATGISEPLDIVVSEQEFSSKFDSWAQPGNRVIRFHSFLGNLQPGELVLTGKFDLWRSELVFRMQIELNIEGGKRTANLVRLQVGQLYMPKTVRNLSLYVVEKLIDAGLPRIPIYIETLLVEEKEIVVSGSTNGL
tara:strand:+ start:333 stop:947 length:615 start_codon:yes stop_codon:yes gene_type:complete